MAPVDLAATYSSKSNAECCERGVSWQAQAGSGAQSRPPDSDDGSSWVRRTAQSPRGGRWEARPLHLHVRGRRSARPHARRAQMSSSRCPQTRWTPGAFEAHRCSKCHRFTHWVGTIGSATSDSSAEPTAAQTGEKASTAPQWRPKDICFCLQGRRGSLRGTVRDPSKTAPVWLCQPARVALMDSRNRTKNGARFSASAQQQQHSMDNILWSPIPIPFLARPPPRDANAPPPALPRMRSHALRPRRMGVPKELVGGALVEENGGHARLGLGVEHRLIKQEVVSCARHAKSKSAE